MWLTIKGSLQLSKYGMYENRTANIKSLILHLMAQ